MTPAFRVEGLSKLATTLEQLPTRVSKRIVQEALLEAAEPMRKTAATLAPRAPGAPDMADHIVAAAVDGRASRGAVAVAVGPERRFFYGLFQEYGTVHHGAQPFLRPAFDTGARPAIDVLSRSMWSALVARGFGSRGISTGGGLL